jgi:xanthine dehydrogenase accessory factor
MPADEDPARAVAQGAALPESRERRILVAVFATPVARFLLGYAADLGYRARLLEPDSDRAAAAEGWLVTTRRSVADVAADLTGEVGRLGADVDVVVTDHHRPELGSVLRDVLTHPVRWVGVLGKPEADPPHVPALRELGVSEAEIARVHRPIGLNIGSRTPAEIAMATAAGLIADRNQRPGGFAFGVAANHDTTADPRSA